MRITLATGTSAELARPADDRIGPTFGLVVIPDIGGMRPLFDDLVSRLANDHGWVVCAFEPFPGLEDKPLEWRLDNVGALDDQRLLADAVAAADATGCAAVGIIGFCMGGMFALKAAGTGRFRRAVSFYGMIRVPDNWASPTQGQPLDHLGRDGACPVLEIAGTADPWVPEADLDALRAAGGAVLTYDGADHGFVHDASRPTHRPDDAADAWDRAVAFLTT